jgi:DNA helicase II / ATP-dependent DNA helicase PcrA
VMFLAACSYMLRPIIQILRKHAIPFHNPFRCSNGFWNPLRITRRQSSANRFLALLAAHPAFGNGYREWTAGELHLWTEWLTDKGTLRSSARGHIREFAPTQAVTAADLEAILEPTALESLITCLNRDHRALLSWWRSRVSGAMQNRVQFSADIAAARGAQALLERPKVIVGTIHSVKGGEADVVILFPDLSQSGDVAYQRFGAPRDAVIRMFYVGMTRPREALYLAGRASNLAVRLDHVIR